MKAITYYDNNYSDLGNVTSEVNKKYCSKHNIKFIIKSDSRLSEGRPSAWAKIKAIREEIDGKNDWILWVDSDAIFTNFEKNIFDLTDDNFNFIFSTDGYYAKPYHYWPSTAVFLIKNNEKSIEFLEEIWNQPQEIIHHCWWENMGLLKAINENINLRASYKILEYKSIFSQIENWQKQDMMMHIGGGLKVNNEKYLTMKNFIKNECL